MKIDPATRTAPVSSSQPAPAKPGSPATPAPGWAPAAPTANRPIDKAPVSDHTARAALTAHATAAVSQALANPGQPHGFLEHFGEALGLGLGVVVTEALALLPSWNTPVVGPDGTPASSVPGADRQGDHPLLKRHQEVVGPQIAALVATLEPGAVRDLLDGLARGATAAPGTSYRLEASAADLFK